jgi:hypothetical protein
VVRVKSLRLFELSAFSAELRRGGESIPLIPPFIELPVIGSFARLPVKPGTVYHRSFAIISAVVLPTAADLATTVTASPDLIISPIALKLKAELAKMPDTGAAPSTVGPTPAATVGMGATLAAAVATGTTPTSATPAAGGAASPAPAAPNEGSKEFTYTLVARRQNGDTIRSEDVPFKGADPEKAPINLTWASPGDDVRYDLYRKQGNDAWYRISRDLKGSHYDDKTGKQTEKLEPPSATTFPSFAVISPASFLARTVGNFHNRMLKCIAEEATHGQNPTCKTLTLATIPPKGK